MTGIAPPPPYYTPQAPPQPRGSGMAITALVLACVSLLLCWVPIVNNLFFGIAVIALVLGIIAARRATKGKAGGRGVARAAAVVSLVAIAGVLASQAFYAAVLDDVGDELDKASERADERMDGNFAKSGDDVAAEAEADQLALGESATVGEYQVTLTTLDSGPRAAKSIKKANMFNEKAEGRYVLASLDVAFEGGGEGDPWLDLGLTLAGADARNYDTSTCDAVVPQAVMDVPTLRSGGTASFQVCFDVPRAALGEGASIYAEESLSFDDGDRAYWSMG